MPRTTPPPARTWTPAPCAILERRESLSAQSEGGGRCWGIEAAGCRGDQLFNFFEGVSGVRPNLDSMSAMGPTRAGRFEDTYHRNQFVQHGGRESQLIDDGCQKSCTSAVLKSRLAIGSAQQGPGRWPKLLSRYASHDRPADIAGRPQPLQFASRTLPVVRFLLQTLLDYFKSSYPSLSIPMAARTSIARAACRFAAQPSAIRPTTVPAFRQQLAASSFKGGYGRVQRFSAAAARQYPR
jgi:hypothetical protein